MGNLYLIGMMGCGKTTCARILRHRIGMPSIDTDSSVAAGAGLSVSEIFAAFGESRFRAMETDVLRDIAGWDGWIVACGGGLPLQAVNREILRRSGTVFFLNRDPGVTYDTLDLSGRPLAQDGREAFLARYRDREPVYREAADYVIDSCDTPEDAVSEIIRIWEGIT